jgi:hypothetical protein
MQEHRRIDTTGTNDTTQVTSMLRTHTVARHVINIDLLHGSSYRSERSVRFERNARASMCAPPSPIYSSHTHIIISLVFMSTAYCFSTATVSWLWQCRGCGGYLLARDVEFNERAIRAKLLDQRQQLPDDDDSMVNASSWHNAKS